MSVHQGPLPAVSWLTCHHLASTLLIFNHKLLPQSGKNHCHENCSVLSATLH